MARVAGVNIPDKKQAWISLTHIYGIGRTRALKICSETGICLLYTSPSPRDDISSRMPSSA